MISFSLAASIVVAFFLASFDEEFQPLSFPTPKSPLLVKLLEPIRTQLNSKPLFSTKEDDGSGQMLWFVVWQGDDDVDDDNGI
jgi:hypothetical protein